MAGAGFKTFGVGDVLTASDVNTYLMEQAVMTFADSGARGSAIGTATEGMLSYLADTNAVEVYDGSAWGPVGASPAILQVVSTTKQDVFTTTSTSYTDITGLSVSITPSSSSSKVLVIVSLSFASTSSNTVYAQILRDSTAVGGGTAAGNRSSAAFFDRNYELDGGSATHAPYSHHYLDSPSTTSSTTYKIQMAVSGGTGVVNRTWNDSDVAYYPRLASSITVMEVAA